MMHIQKLTFSHAHRPELFQKINCSFKGSPVLFFTNKVPHVQPIEIRLNLCTKYAQLSRDKTDVIVRAARFSSVWYHSNLVKPVKLYT